MENINNNQLFNKFFNLNSFSEIEVAIITPVSLFIEYAKEICKDVNYEYRNARYCNIYSKDKKAIIIKVPNGANHIIDVMYILNKTKVKKVIFIGLCASLKENVNIGDIVTPKLILRLEKLSDCISNKMLFTTGNLNLEDKCPKESIEEIHILSTNHITISSMYEEISIINELKELSLETLDMECSTFYAALEKFQLDGLAFMVVSDRPNKDSIFYLNRLDDIVLYNSRKILYNLMSSIDKNII